MRERERVRKREKNNEYIFLLNFFGAPCVSSPAVPREFNSIFNLPKPTLRKLCLLEHICALSVSSRQVPFFLSLSLSLSRGQVAPLFRPGFFEAHPVRLSFSEFGKRTLCSTRGRKFFFSLTPRLLRDV